MTDHTLPRGVRPALLVLRITLGVFLLQWGLEKFVVPESAVGIWGYFYGVSITQGIGFAFGAIEIALAFCLFLGTFRTPAYGAAMGLHAVSVLVSWRQLIDPWSDPVAHLFIAGLPVLGAFVALFLLRHLDRGVLDRHAALPA